MRLINTSTGELCEFNRSRIPPYAILSHTWGDDEYIFSDRHEESRRECAGFEKISSCCDLAASEGWDYLWVDTCCIDKSSSAELTESINSMYKWYQNAEICYVYLADFSITDCQLPNSIQFTESRWFTRGWTLQELLAPQHVVFYDRDWIELGSRSCMKHRISETTGISPEHMEQPKSASVAAKMCWASHRQTTREEDMAYCLLGLFDLNMPLIYGEGHKAFFRLQSEIIRTSSDESIYAWTTYLEGTSGLLARSPRPFRESGDIVPIVGPGSLRRPPPHMTSRGLAIEIMEPLNLLQRGDDTLLDIPLNCANVAQIKHPVKLRLRCRGQVATRISVSKLEFYDVRVLDLDINVKSCILYVENKVIFPRRFRVVPSSVPLRVKITLAVQNHLNYLKSPNSFVQLSKDGTILRSSQSFLEQALIWFQFQDGLESIIVRRYHRGPDVLPEVRIYTLSSISDFSVFAEAWEKYNLLNVFDQLPPPTSILSEPYESTTLPLGNGEFLWIKTTLPAGHATVNVHIDVTSIDRSRILLH